MSKSPRKKKETVCPECAGSMKYDRYVRLMVCQRCGLAVTREELDKMRAELRKFAQVEDTEDEKRRSRKEYLDWYLGQKE
jgi:transcription initiation factor TFIIIB Brf1 subunit/transcription initiation factor TFIIB